MKHRVSPLLLLLILSTLSLGWRRSTPPLPQGLENPASMTLDGDRLLVSDAFTGLHIYDVSDLTAPTKVIQIPLDYNRGSAVKDDIIYANDAGQLQAIRLTEDGYTVVARIGVKYTEWSEGPIDGDTESFSCFCSTGDFATAPTSPGGGSSYATFSVIDNYLYRVDYSSLIVYDVTTADKPEEASRIDIGWDIETLHPSLNFLFVGGQRGMYIFDRTDPERPKQISKIQHARACDPVVVSGSTAYVTLRGNNNCGMSPDELLCVTIKDPYHPAVIGEKLVTTPYGLAVQNSRVYVSHGDNGYSLLDVSRPQEPSVEKTWTGEATRDFIWSGNTLFVLNDRNVSIYDVSDPLAPKLLSRVEPASSS